MAGWLWWDPSTTYQPRRYVSRCAKRILDSPVNETGKDNVLTRNMMHNGTLPVLPEIPWQQSKQPLSRQTRKQGFGLHASSIPAFTPTQTNCSKMGKSYRVRFTINYDYNIQWMFYNLSSLVDVPYSLKTCRTTCPRPPSWPQVHRTLWKHCNRLHSQGQDWTSPPNLQIDESHSKHVKHKIKLDSL